MFYGGAVKDLKRLRASILKYEDRKMTAAQLGRDILHVAGSIHDPTQARLRQTLSRLGQRFVALSERAMQDDVQSDLRATIDDLHDELLDFEA